MGPQKTDVVEKETAGGAHRSPGLARGGFSVGGEKAKRRRRLDVAATGRPISSLGATLSRQPLVLASARRPVWTSNTLLSLLVSLSLSLFPSSISCCCCCCSLLLVPYTHTSSFSLGRFARWVAGAKPRALVHTQSVHPRAAIAHHHHLPPPLYHHHYHHHTHSQHLPIALSLVLVPGSVAVLVVVELLVPCRTSLYQQTTC